MACIEDRLIGAEFNSFRVRRDSGKRGRRLLQVVSMWTNSSAAVSLAVLFFAALSLSACSSNPTPYQALGEEGGFEESRLQPRVFRVSFKGNRHTREPDVLDFLFLRCAELTAKNGFTHFVIQEDYGRTQMNLQGRGTGPRFQFGFGFSNRRSFWGLGFGVPFTPNYSATVSYHLAMFVIKMLKPGEAAAYGDKAFNASFMIESLSGKKEKSLRKGS